MPNLSEKLPQSVHDAADALPRRPATRRERLIPVAYAGGLLAAGAALLIARPRLGQVPAPDRLGSLPRRRRWRRAAQVGRDNVQAFAPDNVTDSIGRSLVVGGAALLLARLLDEAAGHDGQ